MARHTNDLQAQQCDKASRGLVGYSFSVIPQGVSCSFWPGKSSSASWFFDVFRHNIYNDAYCILCALLNSLWSGPIFDTKLNA